MMEEEQFLFLIMFGTLTNSLPFQAFNDTKSGKFDNKTEENHIYWETSNLTQWLNISMSTKFDP